MYIFLAIFFTFTARLASSPANCFFSPLSSTSLFYSISYGLFLFLLQYSVLTLTIYFHNYLLISSTYTFLTFGYFSCITLVCSIFYFHANCFCSKFVYPCRVYYIIDCTGYPSLHCPVCIFFSHSLVPKYFTY